MSEKIIIILLELCQDLAPHLSISAEDQNKDLQEIGFDSLDISTLTLEIEGRFDLKINDDDMQRLKSLNDYVNYIQKHTS